MNRSSQREAILEVLRACKSHPTADELYAMLRSRMPRLSLATVYRNLEQLANAGIVLALDGAGARRFDGNIVPHYHKRCSSCGCVSDLPDTDFKSLNGIISAILPKIECDSCSIEFAGTCDKCNTKKPEYNK